MAMRSKKAIIIGAGIGGLAAGIALHQAGMEVEIFERAPAIRELGAGISLWANAIHALHRLGLGDALSTLSVPYAMDGLRSSNGAPLVKISMTELERQIGTAIVVLHRADLLGLLLKALGTQHIRFGASCVGCHLDTQGATASFADGRQVRSDLIVGADGLHSVIRAALHRMQPPRYAGCTAWRAVVPFPAEIQASESWGQGSVFGKVPMRGNQVYWYATKNVPEGERSPNEKAELLRLFQGWHAPIEALIEATDDSAIVRNDIYDRPCLRTWGKGCVTLLGDAAHPMTPFLGQGGCQALEDAVVLGQCVRNAVSIEAALRAYERERVPRANALVKRSRAVGRIAQLQWPLAVTLRNAAFRLASPRLHSSQLARIVGHRV